MLVNSIVIAAPDLVASTEFYRVLAGDPVVENPHYVGFESGAIHVGLDPQGEPGAGGVVAYWDTTDLPEVLEVLTKAGGSVHEQPREVGGGASVATVKDPAGNLVGVRALTREGP